MLSIFWWQFISLVAAGEFTTYLYDYIYNILTYKESR